jgi:hypothetical protein
MFAFLRWTVSVALAAARMHVALAWWARVQTQEAAAGPAAGIPRELSGTELEVLNFYAVPASITTEESASICFGVLNAEWVTIEPDAGPLRPAVSRCITASPRVSTTYTLTAADKGGRTISRSFTLPVTPAPARFLLADTSERKIRRGEPFSVCNGVKNATAVALLPVAPSLPPLERFCYRYYPPSSTRFTLTATGPGGAAEPLRFAVSVVR